MAKDEKLQSFMSNQLFLLLQSASTSLKLFYGDKKKVHQFCGLYME